MTTLPAASRSPAAASASEALGAELLQVLIDSVTDYAIFALDPNGVVTTWNPGAERLKGYSPEEIIGQHFSRFYPDSDCSAGVPDRELAIAAAEGHFEDEGWRLRKDGSRIWASVVITALRGGDGRLLGFGKVTRDFTERKHGQDALQESEKRFRLLVNSVADHAIFLLTPAGTVASWNIGAERLKGYHTDEIIGRDFAVFYTDSDRRKGVPEAALREALEQGHRASEGWRLRKDGSRFWAEATITALHSDDGCHQGFAKVTRDLTERKRNDDALRGILERERSAAAHLRELDQMKNELVAIIAHDLHGPIGVIQGFLHLLAADWETTTNDEKLEVIDKLAGRAESLGELVDDILDIARIETGHLTVDRSPIDLGDAIARVVSDAAASAPERVMNVHSDGVAAIGDERRTWQVLGNLLSNALKYSPPDSPIDLTAERIQDEVVVSVVDRGAGIPLEQQSLLFQRFSRLPQNSNVPGSGIGLFIARSLVEAQHGRMWVDSAPGSGSAFRFALPATTSASTP